MSFKRKNESPCGSSKRMLQLQETQADNSSDSNDDSETATLLHAQGEVEAHSSALCPETEVHSSEEEHSQQKDDAKSAKFQCPCNCTSTSPPSLQLLRTHERDTMKMFVFRFDTTHYKGKPYSVDDIAPVWKKDCRTWLWK